MAYLVHSLVFSFSVQGRGCGFLDEKSGKPQRILRRILMSEFSDKKVIIVADDDKEIRKLLQLMLEPHLPGNYLEATNGDELELLLEQQGTNVALVIADIIMGSKNSLDVAQHARASGLNVPFIFISGYYDHDYLRRVEKIPDTVFFLKPADSQLLKEQAQYFFFGMS